MGRAQLAEWNSPQEAKAIAKYFRKKNAIAYTLWIGLRQIRSTGGDWKWDSGKKVSYQPWLSSKAKSKSYQYECAHVIMGGKNQVKRSVGKWGGSSCYSSHYTVCMKKCKSKSNFVFSASRYVSVLP